MGRRLGTRPLVITSCSAVVRTVRHLDDQQNPAHPKILTALPVFQHAKGVVSHRSNSLIQPYWLHALSWKMDVTRRKWSGNTMRFQFQCKTRTRIRLDRGVSNERKTSADCKRIAMRQSGSGATCVGFSAADICTATASILS